MLRNMPRVHGWSNHIPMIAPYYLLGATYGLKKENSCNYLWITQLYTTVFFELQL